MLVFSTKSEVSEVNNSTLAIFLIQVKQTTPPLVFGAFPTYVVVPAAVNCRQNEHNTTQKCNSPIQLPPQSTTDGPLPCSYVDFGATRITEIHLAPSQLPPSFPVDMQKAKSSSIPKLHKKR